MLRDYQERAILEILEGLASGSKRQILSMATGLGKTVVFVDLAKRLKARTLVLVHRDELVTQALARFREWWPEVTVGVVEAEQDEWAAPCVIASVQTLAYGGGKRMARWPKDHFELVVVDEAHHAVAESYRTILSRFEPKLLLGVTATPFRGDAITLETVFDHIVKGPSILDGIRAGHLVDIRAYRVGSTVDLDGVHTRYGDFAGNELEQAVNTYDRNRAAVEAYRAYAPGKRALVFAVGVDHAHNLASQFMWAGIPAAAISGETPIDMRRDILGKLRTGEVRVVTNCMVLTEGFDAPEVECVLFARPTKSVPLYTQMVGRGTRPFPGKKEMILIDLVDNTVRHHLVSVSVLIGHGVGNGKTVMEELERRMAGPFGGRAGSILRPGIEVIKAGDLFAEMGEPPIADWQIVLGHLEERSALDGVRGSGVPTDRQVKALLGFGWPRAEVDRLTKTEVSLALSEHQKTMEVWASKATAIWTYILESGMRPSDYVWTGAGGLWTLHPATPNQVNYLGRFGFFAGRSLTKGEASLLIDAFKKKEVGAS